MKAIFKSDDSSFERMIGYSNVEYSSSDENEVLVETTEADLADVFQSAADAGINELAGAGEPIEAAIDEPLRYYDYLILEGDAIVFDDTYTRSDEV